MGCNCKGKKGLSNNDNSENKRIDNQPIHEKVIVFIAKTIGFLLGGLIISIIIIPFSLYALFKIIYFEESIDVTGAMVMIGKMLSKGEPKGEVDDEIEEINPDDYELVGVEDISEDIK